jgi:hypothetical protein
VLVEAPLEIGRPSNIGSVSSLAIAAKDIDVTVHKSANVIGGTDGYIRQ